MENSDAIEKKRRRHQYYLNAISKPGYKEKQRERGKRYYQANKEKMKQRAAEWQKAHPERAKELQRAAKARARVKAGKPANPITPEERTCAYCGRKYVVLFSTHASKYCGDECVRRAVGDRANQRYASDPDRIKAQSKRWRENNRERYRLLQRLSKQRAKARRDEQDRTQ